VPCCVAMDLSRVTAMEQLIRRRQTAPDIVGILAWLQGFDFALLTVVPCMRFLFLQTSTPSNTGTPSSSETATGTQTPSSSATASSSEVRCRAVLSAQRRSHEPM